MKLTKSKLKAIIKEEMGMAVAVSEEDVDDLLYNLRKAGILESTADIKGAIAFLEGALQILASGQYKGEEL
jgi:hypothetical protein